MIQRLKKLLSLLLVATIMLTLVPAVSAESVETQLAGPDELLALCNPVGRIVKHEDTMMMEASTSNFTLCGQLVGDILLDVTVEEKIEE